MSSVTFPTVAGGATYTDDSDPTTGLANGGHKTRFIPALKAVVDTAADVVLKSNSAAASAALAQASAAYINGVAGGGTAMPLTGTSSAVSFGAVAANSLIATTECGGTSVTYEKRLFYGQFPSVVNTAAKRMITIPNTEIVGSFEIEIAEYYNTSNYTGKLIVEYEVMHLSGSTTNNRPIMRATQISGTVPYYFQLSPITVAANGNLNIILSNRATSVNNIAVTIRAKCMVAGGSAITAATISSEYTTDATVYSNPPMQLCDANSGTVLVGLPTENASGGCLQLKSGITFPATQVASTDPNTLDDYEEGTFTPAAIGSTTAGVGTYTSLIGSYTKTGRVVTFTLSLNWSAHTGTGGIRLGGLPFVSSVMYTPIVSIFVNNLTYTGTHLHAYVVSGQTYATLAQVASGTSSTEVPMDTAAQVSLSGSYYV